MNETVLIEKLMKIEALYSGATTEGERISAERARQRILARLQELLPKDPPVEYRFTFTVMWSRKVFTALLRRYNLKPYRYHRQRYTTVMVNVPKTFVDETLWPEFQKINTGLTTYLQEVTDRIIKQVLNEDSSDATVVDEPLQIGVNQDPVSENRTDAEAEKTEGSPDIQKSGHARTKKRKKKKKKRRNR